jgi:ankyrin repeat protein
LGSTTKGVLLVRARDDEGRNAVHYAAISQSLDTLEYLLDPRLFPDQPALRLALLHTTTVRGENTALYAIRQRYPPAFLDRLVAAGTPALLTTPAADGLGPLHCAAIADAPELISHLVEKHNLDPYHPFAAPDEQTEDTTNDDLREPVAGDTPLHLAARHNSAAAFEALHERLGVGLRSVRNSAGESAMDVADAVDAEAVLAYLDRVTSWAVPSVGHGASEKEELIAVFEELEEYLQAGEDIIVFYGGRENVPEEVREVWSGRGCRRWDLDDVN